MMKLTNLLLLLLTLCSASVYADIVIIGHDNIGPLNSGMVNRIYTGRVIEVNGVSVEPVNIKPAEQLRNQFLQEYLEQDEDKYTAYWTVRRFIGKGTPPKELGSVDELVNYVRNNKGAIGYIDSQITKVPEGVYRLSE